LKVVDVRNVALWLLAMMMENASNIAMESNTIFSLTMENPNFNATNKSTRFDFKVFYF
jgi:hypothetical protein